MADKDAVVAEVRRLFGDQLGELANRVGDLTEAAAPGYPGEDVAGREEQLTAGLLGLRKLTADRADELTDAELTGLEAIILLEGRPALFIRDGDFAGIHDRHDHAVLTIEQTGGAGQPLPTPLPIAAAKLDAVTKRTVYVIGYPGWDGARNNDDHMREIFGDTYGVKRLQPGLVTSWNPDPGHPGRPSRQHSQGRGRRSHRAARPFILRPQ
jgi:hypothetical protein